MHPLIKRLYKANAAWFLLQAILLMSISLTACTPKAKESKEPFSASMGVYGLLGSNMGVASMSVNGNWGGNGSGWGGGSAGVCCANIQLAPKGQQTTAVVEWRECDIGHIKFDQNGMRLESEKDKEPICYNRKDENAPVYFVDTNIEDKESLGDFLVYIFPGGRAMLWNTNYTPEHPNFKGPRRYDPNPKYAPCKKGEPEPDKPIETCPRETTNLENFK